MRVITPREMAEVDRATIEREGIPGLTLMERAGASVAAVARDMLSERLGSRVAVWCGKGNNGGDGLVTARMLSAAGADVEVFLLSPRSRLSADSRENFDRLNDLPVPVTEVKGPEQVHRFSGVEMPYDLVIDSIFGTGFSGLPEGVYEAAISAINNSRSPVLAVDIPSGVAGDSGAAPGVAVRADVTVTFAAPKVGLVQFPGAGLVGELQVADIGIPDRVLESVPSSRIYLAEGDAIKLPERSPDAHKRQCGSVLVVGGSPGMTGAVAMSARAALRAGAGLVTACVPEPQHDILEIKLTEVMTRPLPADGRGLTEDAASAVLSWMDDYDVLALGPGMGTSDRAVSMARELVAEVEAPLVLDADGLNALSGAPAIMEKREAPLVLTPHPGEMARLLGCSTGEVQADRIAAAVAGAQRWGAVVVLKGARTVVADPGAMVSINPTGNAGMATAGMGDVLTGCLAALLAQGLAPFDAAVSAVYFHGQAADLVAAMDGMVGMTASDVTRHLPLAMRRD